MTLKPYDEPEEIWDTQHAPDGPTDDTDEPGTTVWAFLHHDGRIGLTFSVYPRTEFTLSLPPWEVRSMIDALKRQRDVGTFDD